MSPCYRSPPTSCRDSPVPILLPDGRLSSSPRQNFTVGSRCQGHPQVGRPVLRNDRVFFLLCSLQYLSTKRVFRDAVLRCHQRRLIRLVVIDDAHLHALHGRTLWESIRVLLNFFFQPLFGGERKFSPLPCNERNNDGLSPAKFLTSHTLRLVPGQTSIGFDFSRVPSAKHRHGPSSRRGHQK